MSNRDNDLRHLREAVEAERGEKVEDYAWKYAYGKGSESLNLNYESLVNDSYTEGAELEPDPDDVGLLSMLIDDAREAARLYAESGGPGSPAAIQRHTALSRMKQDKSLLTRHEVSRAWTVGTVYVRQAIEDPLVRQFREKYLNYKPLTLSQAEDFLKSPANRFLTWHEMYTNDVPFVGHSAGIEKEESACESSFQALQTGCPDKLWIERVSVRVTPPGKTFTAERRTTFRVGRHYSTILKPHLSFFDSEGRYQMVTLHELSVLDELRTISEDLARRYSWQLERVPIFILCGVEPTLLPVEFPDFGGDFQFGTITMRIAPWVSAKTVTEYYSYAQRRLLGGKLRPLSDRTLEVFRFVTERGEPPRGKPGFWYKLLQEWNQLHSDKWQCKTVRQFSKEYKQAKKALLFRDYWNKPTLGSD